MVRVISERQALYVAYSVPPQLRVNIIACVALFGIFKVPFVRCKHPTARAAHRICDPLVSMRAFFSLGNYSDR